MKAYVTKSPVNCGPCSFINLTCIKGSKRLENELAKTGKLKPFQVSGYSAFLYWANKYKKDIEVYTGSKSLNNKMFELMFYFEKTPKDKKEEYKKKAKKLLEGRNRKFKGRVGGLRDPIKKLDGLLAEGKRVAVSVADYYLGKKRRPVPHWIVCYRKENGKYFFMDSAKRNGKTVLTRAQLKKAIDLNKKDGFHPALVGYMDKSLRILGIGDFHGTYQKKWNEVIKKQNPDIIICVGDYKPFTLRKEFFKYVYGKKDVELWQAVGKKKYKEATRKEVRAMERIFNNLDKAPMPVVSISGNADASKWPDAVDTSYFRSSNGKVWKWAEQDFFTPAVEKYKNIHYIDYSYFKFRDYVVVAGGPSSFPGRVKSKNYKKLKVRLDRLFKKFRKENKDKKVIFLTHNVAYETKLDKIISKEAHKRAKGRHYGSKLVRRVIDRYQPFLHIAGHIHEQMGTQKLRKTMMVNTGAAHDGQASVIDISEKGKMNIRFIRIK